MSNIVLSQETPTFLQKAGIRTLTKQLAGKSGGIKRIVPKNGINAVRIYNPVKQSLDHDPEGRFIRPLS